MKSAGDGGGLARRGRRLDPRYLLPSPSPNLPYFLEYSTVIIKRATVSDCDISASGEGRDFSEIIAVFLMGNKRVYYSGKLGRELAGLQRGVWGGRGRALRIFPLPALTCQLSRRQDKAGGLNRLLTAMGVAAAFLFQRHAECCWDLWAAGLGQLWVLGARSLVGAAVQVSRLEQRCA